MHYGSRSLFLGLAAAFLATGAVGASAQDEIPLDPGTYAQTVEWCLVNRADQNGPDYKNKRAYINLTQTEINWNQTVGKITNVSIERNKINLSVSLTADGSEKAATMQLTRKSKKIFVLLGVNFYRCNTYMPNPWLGR